MALPGGRSQWTHRRVLWVPPTAPGVPPQWFPGNLEVGKFHGIFGISVFFFYFFIMGFSGFSWDFHGFFSGFEATNIPHFMGLHGILGSLWEFSPTSGDFHGIFTNENMGISILSNQNGDWMGLLFKRCLKRDSSSKVMNFLLFFQTN